MVADILIQNGSIIDGSGASAFAGDIAIKDGKIIAVGSLGSCEAKRVIDAKGQVVAPGFIDIHTHTDFTIQLDNRCESQIRQGVTTEVVGLCGASNAPCTESTRSEIIRPEILKGNWTSFSSYLSALDSAKPGTNLACLVGHGTLRTITMPASTRSREASADEIKAMQYELEKCFEAGAFGLSTGLEYFPGKAANSYELEQLCSVIAKHNTFHACHIRNRDMHGLSAYLEVLEVARNSGSRLQISHMNNKYGRPEKTMERALKMIEWMRDDGVCVGMDVIPSIWNHSFASALLPLWALDLSIPELLSVLKDPKKKSALMHNPEPYMQLHVQGKWDKIYILDAKKTHRYIGMNLAEIAKEKNCDSGWDALFALFIEEEETLHSIVFTGECFPMDDIMEVLQDPYCCVCSDSVASATDGVTKDIKISPDTFTWAERFLRTFILEKKLLSLPEAIRRLTSLPAAQAGIQNRGLIKDGYCADIVVFRPEELNDNATFVDSACYPTGINTVLINGQVVLHDTVRASEQSGMILRANAQ